MQDAHYNTELLERRPLSDNTFEVVLSRPAAFTFSAGQRIALTYAGIEREYSLASAPDDDVLVLCIRRVAGGRLSPQLATVPPGTGLSFSGPKGYFVFRPRKAPPIFIATGTGVAPFAAMVRAGVKGFTLLHGVRLADDCCYASLFRSRARHYVPCVSQKGAAPAGVFEGRVTDYLAAHVAAGCYDFYLCGRSEMIRDVTWLIDDRFTGSLIHTEIFY
jgi:ferredoxin-NADP reductase